MGIFNFYKTPEEQYTDLFRKKFKRRGKMTISSSRVRVMTAEYTLERIFGKEAEKIMSTLTDDKLIDEYFKTTKQ
jgi:hypothetical protein